MTIPQALDPLDRLRDRRAYRAAEQAKWEAEEAVLAVFWAMEHTKNAFFTNGENIKIS